MAAPPLTGIRVVELARILAQALHPEAERRFAACSDFREALLDYLGARHPGTGPEHLQAWVHTLFADELAREREMLLGFTHLDADSLSESLEASRSMSVSLAHADFVADHTALDAKAPSTRVVHDETWVDTGKNPVSTGAATILDGEGEVRRLGSSLLDGKPPVAPLTGNEAPALTPATGTLPQELAHLAAATFVERTEVLQRAPAKPPAGRMERRGAMWAAAGLLAFVLFGIALALSRVGDGAGDAANADARAATRQASFPQATHARLGGGEDGEAEVPLTPDAPVVRAERVAPAEVAPVEVAPVEAAPVEAALPEDSPSVAPAASGVRGRRLKGKRSEGPGHARVDPKVADLLRRPLRKRMSMIAGCRHACKSHVLGSYPKLLTKLKTAPRAERAKARRQFDDAWLRCYQRCQ